MSECNVKYYGSMPTNESTIICCSIFRLRHSYNPSSLYVSGLETLIKYATAANYHMVIYYDHSIRDEESFRRLYNMWIKHPKVLFCYYVCPSFVDNETHKGFFGAHVRLLPIFTDIDIPFKGMFIADIDLSIGQIKMCVDTHLPIFMQSKYEMAFHYKIGYEYRYANELNIPGTNVTVLFNTFTKKKILNSSSLFTFLKRLLNNDPTLQKKFEAIKSYFTYQLKHANELGQDRKSKLMENYVARFNDTRVVYGTDELYLNQFLIPAIIDEGIPIGCFYTYDTYRLYPYKIIDMNQMTNADLDHIFLKVIGHNPPSNISHKDYIRYIYDYLGKDQNIPAKYKTVQKILRRFTYYIEKYSHKYPHIRQERVQTWIINLMLHRKKGVRGSLLPTIITQNYHKVDLKPFIKIYSMKWLMKRKRIFT